MWKGHPLADRELLTLEELADYPCLSFEQGNYNSFYFAEEVLSTYDYKQFIKANDRATMHNLMVGLNGYTLCSGILCEKLNGSEFCAVKLKSDERMIIGYLVQRILNNWHIHLSNCPATSSENLARPLFCMVLAIRYTVNFLPCI